MIKYPKTTFTYFTIFLYTLFALFFFLHAHCSADVQRLVITKEDILNATPVSPYKVVFSKKDLHYIEVMEKRHFPRTYPEFSDGERVKNLEYELLGRVWEFTPQEDRIKRLKLASSNTMLQGPALPPSISSRLNAKRMRNDSIQMRKKDNVGLIDGFLRLVSPEKYDVYRQYSDEIFEKYD